MHAECVYELFGMLCVSLCVCVAVCSCRGLMSFSASTVQAIL